MDKTQKAKMERYLRNADRFMWGILPGNKKAVFTALRTILAGLGQKPTLVPDEKKITFDTLTDRLLGELGIERVLTDIVVKEIRRQFARRIGALDFLRAHWMSGTLPRWQTLQTLRAPKTAKQVLAGVFVSQDDARKPPSTSDIVDAFIEVNTQYNFVRGWTVFAGLWFEELEPPSRQADEDHDD